MTKAKFRLKRQPKKLPTRLWHDKVRKILGQDALDQLRSPNPRAIGGGK